jgi:hypothetical protein
VARSFIVYQGEDETPEFDLTDPESNVHVKFEEIEAGGKAFRGESTTNSIPVRDQSGETGNELNLPGGLTHVSLSRGSRWEWQDGPDGAEVRMAAGRIGTKDYTRGVQKADRAREVVMQCGDRNEELQDIIVDAWDRPEESDVTRVLALLADYLDGSPRTTTVIADTYVSSDGPVTLPARLYDGTNPRSILQEIAQFANKEFFVTIDDELWYDVATSDSYVAGLRISDRPEEWTSETSSPGPSSVRLYPSSHLSGESGTAESLAAPEGGDLGWLGGWDDTSDGVHHYMYDSPGGTASEGFVDWQGINTAAQEFGLISAVHRLDGDLLTIIQGGGTASSQFRYKSRHGIGVDESAQRNYPEWSARVYRPGSGYVATLWSLTVGSIYFNARNPPTNRSLSVEFAAFASAADGDYVVVELGVSHVAPTSGPTGAHIYFTDDEAVDLPIDDSTTTAYNSWIQFGPAEEALPTFGPRWDVGAASTEDGLELVSGLRLYYGQQGDYVHVTDPTTEAEYWHAERSFYTSDVAIDDATKATVLAEAILQRLKFEDRTYNVSVGPLYPEHVGLLKPGQLVDIKARAIPDADDQFVSRRIAQLKWTTPRPGVFWARMQLDRPLKEAPYGVGPKQAAEEIAKHTQASSSHTASQVTIIDSGGFYTGTDVEAALQELAGGSGVSDVVDHGTMGASEDFDFTAGTDHEGVLDQNLTVTLSGATNDEAAWMTLKLTQDGTGTNTVDLPASVANATDIEAAFDTAANAVNVLTVFTYDGGTTWYAFLAGSDGGGASSLDDLTDVTITSPATADRLRFDGSEWANSSLIWRPVMAFDGTNWYVVVDGDGNAVMAEG